MNSKPRVLIAEDHMLMAEGLRKLIECEFPVVEIVDNGEALLRAVATFRPDVALLDIGMPLVNGLEAARRCRAMAPNVKIIILTAHDEAEYVVEAFRAGATGYVLKRCAAAELLEAIRQVLNGHSYVTPKVAQPVATLRGKMDAAKGRVSLTERQREVLRMVAEGLTAKEIANLLHLSAKTAVFHKMAIMDKLGLRTTAELTRYAIEHGIVASKFIPVALRVPASAPFTAAPETSDQGVMPAIAAVMH